MPGWICCLGGRYDGRVYEVKDLVRCVDTVGVGGTGKEEGEICTIIVHIQVTKAPLYRVMRAPRARIQFIASNRLHTTTSAPKTRLTSKNDCR